MRKYISPFIGIYKLYVNKFFLNKEIIYVNYLPIWNFLLFLFFPNKIILGPITGSDYYTNINNINNKIRIILFPFFNSISKSLIKRKKKIIFSTNLIDYNCNNAIKNFQLIYFLNRKNSLQKKTKKKIDFLFYYRNHPNKNQNKIFKILKILKKNGHVIKICGDKLNIFDQENIGYLNKKKLNETLSMSKFILASTENPISFFVQDAMLNNVSVVFDQNSKKIASEYFQNYISINLLKIAKNSKSFFLKKNFKKTSFNQDILSTLRKNLIY